uniref:Immulectin 6 n=1 Tax=Hepialus xiaojinensis TaxID=1589740 RepID=A0A219YXH2_9NEOP|nr:immulectin 6 [Hepialus xiaojinensis]
MIIQLSLIICVLVEFGYVLAGENRIFRYDYEFSDEINSYFRLHKYPRSWVNARTRCRHEGAQLYTPANGQEADFVKLLHEDLHSDFNGIYLGLNAYFSEGDFASTEEQSVLDLYNVWNDGEPNNMNDIEDCAVMTRTGKYSDVACNQVFPFLCARPEAGLTWNSACNTYDMGYQSSPGLSSCFKIHTDPKNWTNGYATCKAEGGYLAIVNSVAEKSFLVKMFAENPAGSLRGNFWKDVLLIGFHDWFMAREYEYLDGPRVPLTKFSGGEPNDFAPGERCGAMYRNGLFDDIWCNRPNIFACERPLVAALPPGRGVTPTWRSSRNR